MTRKSKNIAVNWTPSEKAKVLPGPNLTPNILSITAEEKKCFLLATEWVCLFWTQTLSKLHLVFWRQQSFTHPEVKVGIIGLFK